MRAEIRKIAIETAIGAGRLLKEKLGGVNRVEFKGAIDLVTEADRSSERFIMGEVQKAFPGHGILSEESPEVVSKSPYKWIIDPLDGTTNYSHAFPFFCVSIAFEEAGEVTFGAVYDPMLDELFTAEKEKGAALNGAPIRVSGTNTLDRSLLATGFPYDLRSTKDNNLDNFSAFSLKAQAIRRAGSAALDLCYTACGRFDGYWEMKLRPWDVAAGALIVAEAGGVLTDFKGGPFSIYGKECLASNGLIHESMTRVLTGR
ncbi:MAG TPA: inositol monophosphatase [Deltaproteobacteria bacterium]|nr:MAG: inositol monophosphatase [Deltaproteobacteria bacterium GWA2_55_82]OGQ64770.1 MAG: inositol monophosphatase [Deltaproteobacteria bacterium RIFCSPLOWO2_02_FULL_55_12]OIJ72618.1 MAG: inositol monophosphatase [Deltaproteobacteria bacterium GWC2_55_46]HBG47220.1 inositol monophosphatase [Deltaproteobacteria bacterium]HCY11964.1 inositol monophosphatase [Deltaproteobacteria bacterium]